jgi:hypothetical protein
MVIGCFEGCGSEGKSHSGWRSVERVLKGFNSMHKERPLELFY